MRFFKHGDSLAIVLPEPIRKKQGIKDDDEFELMELSEGVVLLVSKKLIASWAKEKAVNELHALLGGKPKASETKDLTRELLFKQGFLIISRAEEAQSLSEKFEKEIKAGGVIGARSFDKTFYIVTKEYFESVSRKMEKALSGKPLSVPALADAVKESINGCKAVVEVLRDQGELIEKKKGEFAFVS